MRFIVTLILALLMAGPRFQPESLAADIFLASCGRTQVSGPTWTDADNDDWGRYLPTLHPLSVPLANADIGTLDVRELDLRFEWAAVDLYTLHLALLI
jgi:hypothetical protein